MMFDALMSLMRCSTLCCAAVFLSAFCLAAEPIGFADNDSRPDGTSLSRLQAFAQSVGIEVKSAKVAVTESGHYNLSNGYDTFLNSFAAQGASVLCLPWADETAFGYDSASWQIDSWLWHHVEVLPVFHDGQYAASSARYRTAQASAHSVLSSADPASTAIDAYKMRQSLLSSSAHPSSALVRASLDSKLRYERLNGVGGFRHYDHIAYSTGSTSFFAVRTSQRGPLVISLAWIDPGGWSSMADRGDELAIKFSLSVSAVLNGEYVAYETLSYSQVKAERCVVIHDAPPGNYLVTIACEFAIDPSTAGGAAALAVRGGFDASSSDSAETVEIDVRREGARKGSCTPNEGCYRILRGETLDVAFAPYAYADDGHGEYARYPLSSVVTNGTVYTARWTEEVSDYRLRRYLVVADDFDAAELLKDEWVPKGTEVVFDIPADSPRGEKYEERDVSYRFAGLSYAYTGLLSSAFPVKGERLLMDGGYDLAFSYLDEKQYDEYWSERIPSYWFCRYLLDAWYDGRATGDEDDPDGDGFTNYEEYCAATDPNDADDFLRITEVAPQGISFRGGRDRNVRLLEATRLTSPDWHQIPVDSPLKSGRFYRLSVPEL